MCRIDNLQKGWIQGNYCQSKTAILLSGTTWNFSEPVLSTWTGKIFTIQLAFIWIKSPTADLESAGYYFFCGKSFLMVLFRGRFRRGQDMFYQEIVPGAAKDNLKVKIVGISQNNLQLDIFPQPKNNVFNL